MITAILITVGVLAIILLLLAARGTSPAIHQAEDLQQLMQSVDIEAFRNLISQDEELFLRRALSGREFRKVQRARAAATLAYVKVLARNSSALLRFAEAAKTSTDPHIASAAEDLAHNAMQLRLYSLMAMLKLYLALLSPRLAIGPTIVDRYQALAGNVVHFVSLSRPRLASTIAESL